MNDDIATRSGEFAAELLVGDQGYLQTDGYSGYNRIGVETEWRARFDAGTIDSATFVARRRGLVDPIVVEFRDWLDRAARSVAPQSALGKAIAYAVGQLDRAVRFVEHELLTPDTNAAVNAIRPFVVGQELVVFGHAIGRSCERGYL